MKIAIGSDHVGFEIKETVIDYLMSLGHSVEDFGTYSNERVDYPDYSVKVGKAVLAEEYDRGILICGTGVGISIAANKMAGIRAVVCSEPYSAKLSKEHNDTNILAFGSRVVGEELAKMIVFEWLNATFEGGRHSNRINKINELE